MDGWNELDPASRRRVSVAIRALQREFPGIGFIISTRRQALNVPITGPVVEIDALTEDQQLEIARALRGHEGEALLDHAWRASGVRELVAIPLYLTALLAHSPGGTLPTTKEEVLRLFVTEHERSAEKAETLREALYGFHKEMLTALAVEATHAANTTISENQARMVVTRIEDQLLANGQITIRNQPATVLDILVNHHLLIRSGAETRELSFQHQQFQEWYASFEVEALMRTPAASNPDASQKFRTEVLNIPAWEEPILFACERASRADEAGIQAVAASILETTAIDPMLAAEMIYRSSTEVWKQIKDKIIAFVGRWHSSGKVDRAVHFMINTGRSEFAPQIWPLISDVGSQVYLVALRAGRRFRPSVLGTDVEMRLTQLPEELRGNVLSEIVFQSGMDGIELAARLAKVDASPKVQASVIEALHFRRADRFVAEVLRTAPDEVWRLLASKGYAEEIADPDASARLRREWQLQIERETDLLRKLRMLLDAGRHGAPLGREVGELIEAADFQVKDRDAKWIIGDAYKLYPADTASALLHRLEAGLEIPFSAERLLQAANIVVDEGTLVEHLMRPDISRNFSEDAVSIVGPKTIGKLIDSMIMIHRRWKESQERTDETAIEEYHRLSDLISRTGLSSFIQALLSRSMTAEPRGIALLADLLARHGKGEYEEPIQLGGELHEQLIATVGRWAEILLASAEASRAQLAEVARTIGRLAAPQLEPQLRRMLEQELTRWRRSREEFLDALSKGKGVRSDAQTSWTLQYRRAFAAIGDDHVVELMKAYLPDAGYCGFGIDAAHVLKEIYDRQRKDQKDKRLMSWPDFSDVKAKQAERQDPRASSKPSEFADAIIAVVNDLLKPDLSEEAHRHALGLATIAFKMPYGNKTDTIEKLLQLPRPLREKQALLTVLVQAGEMIHADMVLNGIKTLLEDARAERWRLDENHGELDGWLELLPFTDRPNATSDALELLEPNLRQPWRLRRLLSALGHAPSPDAERLLTLLPQRDPRFLSEHEWFAALDKRGTLSAARILLDFVCAGAFAAANGRRDVWTLSTKLAGAMRACPDFRGEVYRRFEKLSPGPDKAIIEHAIIQVADTPGILMLVRDYAISSKAFDATLHSAIRNVAVGERTSMDFPGAKQLVSVPVPELRKSLFSMVNTDAPEARLATSCLVAIDEIRDEYGSAESEPRHPDIDSGRPWPVEAD
jgi:hypothetical protein